MHYDIAIVGAGLVGASLAVALNKGGLKIALIDAVDINPADQRLFALNMSSVQFLKNTGVWPLIAQHASPIEKVHVSRRKQFGVVQLNASDANLSALGYMMPARYIEGALTNLLSTMSQLDCYRPMQLTAMIESDEGVQLSLLQGDHTKVIHANYVMGADGTQSTVRKLMSFDLLTEDYHETAIVAEIMLNRDHAQIAYERFYEGGVLAMLPLRERTFAMILSASSDDATRLLALTDSDFLAHVQTIFGNRVGKLQAVSARASYPLRLVLAKTAATKRVLLLGNAAHTVHPVAAQGFNLALYEVALLIDEIQAALKDDAQLVDLNCREIQSQFSTQQALSIHTSRRLTSLLHQSSVLADVAMQCGLVAFEALPFIKRKFLSAMLGRLSRVPRLMAD